MREKVDYCKDNEHLLNEWEQEFIESIDDRLASFEDLTPRQEEKLDEIYARIGGPA